MSIFKQVKKEPIYRALKKRVKHAQYDITKEFPDSVTRSELENQIVAAIEQHLIDHYDTEPTEKDLLLLSLLLEKTIRKRASELYLRIPNISTRRQ